MEYDGMYATDVNPEDFLVSNKATAFLSESRLMDQGFNQLKRQVINKKGRYEMEKINVYSTSHFFVDQYGRGIRIRDAETGEYYSHLVGSKDEDLYFKVSFSTGELNSKNNSNKLFYLSPQHCEQHLDLEIPQSVIAQWEVKRAARLYELKQIEEEKKNRVQVCVK